MQVTDQFTDKENCRDSETTNKLVLHLSYISDQFPNQYKK